MAAQLPDKIILDHRILELYSNPLEQYWHVNKRRRPLFISSLGCKRGYVATWELMDKMLILRSIEGRIRRKYFLFWNRVVSYSLKMLFPNVNNNIVASWFTGKIRIPQGKRTFYVHHDYDSRFERELIITIENGKVMKSVVLDYAQQKLEVERGSHITY